MAQRERPAVGTLLPGVRIRQMSALLRFGHIVQNTQFLYAYFIKYFVFCKPLRIYKLIFLHRKRCFAVQNYAKCLNIIYFGNSGTGQPRLLVFGGHSP